MKKKQFFEKSRPFWDVSIYSFSCLENREIPVGELAECSWYGGNSGQDVTCPDNTSAFGQQTRISETEEIAITSVIRPNAAGQELKIFSPGIFIGNWNFYEQ